MKDSQLVLLRLLGLYDSFDESEQIAAWTVFRDWLRSDDEGKRWDAEAVIADRSIIELLPDLEVLAGRLADMDTPGAPYELAKIRRLRERLLRESP